MTREEADALIQSIEAQVDARTVDKTGELYEVTDLNEWPSTPSIVRFHSFDPDGTFRDTGLYGCSDETWKKWRKLNTKASKIPWKGGCCPISPGNACVAQYRSGKVVYIAHPAERNWKWGDKMFSDIEFYWEICL